MWHAGVLEVCENGIGNGRNHNGNDNIIGIDLPYDCDKNFTNKKSMFMISG